MKGQALGLRNGEKGKEKLGLAFVRRIPKEPKKGLDKDTLELPKPGGILEECRKETTRIWTTQGSMLMDTRNEDRLVPSATYDLEKS